MQNSLSAEFIVFTHDSTVMHSRSETTGQTVYWRGFCKYESEIYLDDDDDGKKQMWGISVIGGENVLTFDILQSPLLLMHFQPPLIIHRVFRESKFFSLFHVIWSEGGQRPGWTNNLRICSVLVSYLLRTKFIFVVKQIHISWETNPRPPHLCALIYER